MFESPRHLQYLSLHDIQQRLPEVVLLPIGATEPHGLHLPFGNDAFHATLLANQVAEQAAERGGNALVLPTIPYGVDANQLGFPMALHVRQATLDRIVLDIIESLEHHGIRKVLIFNGHGGNDFAPLVRELSNREGLFLGVVDWWRCVDDVLKEVIDVQNGDHADEMETSVSVHLYPDLCHLERMGDGAFRPFRFEALAKGWVKTSRDWKLLTRDSSCGDPRKATPEKGRRICEAVVERLSAFVAGLSGDEMDEYFPFVKKYYTTDD